MLLGVLQSFRDKPEAFTLAADLLKLLLGGNDDEREKKGVVAKERASAFAKSRDCMKRLKGIESIVSRKWDIEKKMMSRRRRRGGALGSSVRGRRSVAASAAAASNSSTKSKSNTERDSERPIQRCVAAIRGVSRAVAPFEVQTRETMLTAESSGRGRGRRQG